MGLPPYARGVRHTLPNSCTPCYLYLLMPTTCHRCGAALEEGTAFCPSCGAAQIRVPAGDANASPAFPPGTPGNVQPPATPVALAGPLDWSVGFKAAVLTGLLASVPSSLPILSLACCLWVIGGAALTVLLYQKWKPGMVSTGMGARLGAVAGLFSFLFWFLFKAAGQAVRGSEAFKQQLMQQM